MAAAVTAGAQHEAQPEREPRAGAGRGAPVGSVHEETARLFAALEGAAAAWSRSAGEASSGPHRPEPDRAAADQDRLPATCGVCPVCLALDRVGRRHPEVLAHLGEAVQALGAAFTALTSDVREGDAGEPSGRPRHERAPTERIDVTD